MLQNSWFVVLFHRCLSLSSLFIWHIVCRQRPSPVAGLEPEEILPLMWQALKRSVSLLPLPCHPASLCHALALRLCHSRRQRMTRLLQPILFLSYNCCWHMSAAVWGWTRVWCLLPFSPPYSPNAPHHIKLFSPPGQNIRQRLVWPNKVMFVSSSSSLSLSCEEPTPCQDRIAASQATTPQVWRFEVY